MPLESTLSKLNIRQRLEYLEDVYRKSSDIEELTEAYNYVLGLLQRNHQEKGMFLSERNCLLATELLYNTRVKSLLLQYFTQGYEHEDGEALISYIQGKLSKMEEHGFFEMKARFEALSAFLNKLMGYMVEISVFLHQIKDEDGNLCTKDAEQLRKMVNNISEIESKIFADPFQAEEALGEGVELFNLKNRVKKDIDYEISDLKKSLGIAQEMEAKQMLGQICTPFDEVYSGGECEFFPVLPLRKETRANCLFLCSPFLKEVHLYVKSFADEHKRDFVVLEPNQFNGKSADVIRSIFKTLEAQGKDCLITDINTYRNSANLTDLLREMINFGKTGRYIFVIDSVGNRKFYNLAFDVAKADQNLSIMDVSYTYLTMPAYSDTIELFEEKGMITAADY